MRQRKKTEAEKTKSLRRAFNTFLTIRKVEFHFSAKAATELVKGLFWHTESWWFALKRVWMTKSSEQYWKQRSNTSNRSISCFTTHRLEREGALAAPATLSHSFSAYRQRQLMFIFKMSMIVDILRKQKNIKVTLIKMLHGYNEPRI